MGGKLEKKSQILNSKVFDPKAIELFAKGVCLLCAGVGYFTNNQDTMFFGMTVYNTYQNSGR